MPPCPLKPGHILGNSGIVQLWCNVKILLWSSLIVWRLCYQWCITWFGFLSGCCDKILWQKAITERKSRQWESELAAHMTSPQSRAESNELTTYACSLSTLLCKPGCSTQRMEPPTVGRFSHWWRLSPIGQQNLSNPSLRLSFPVIINCANLTMKTQHQLQWSLPWSLAARKCCPRGIAPVWRPGTCLKMPCINSKAVTRGWGVQLAKCLPSVQEALGSVSNTP